MAESALLVTAARTDFLSAIADAPTRLVLLHTGEPVTSEQVLACANEIATECRVKDEDIRVVNYQPEVTDSTALSLDALLPHTDGAFLASPPRYIVMACEHADSAGGASIFVPLNWILDAAPDWALSALSEGRYLFPRTYDGDLSDSFVGPVLSEDGDRSLRIRWRSDRIYQPQSVDEGPPRAAEAIRWLHEFTLNTNCVQEKMQDGDLLAIPNPLYLHGRTELSADSPRVMLRTWVW